MGDVVFMLVSFLAVLAISYICSWIVTVYDRRK
jgi:hypothetical protein